MKLQRDIIGILPDHFLVYKVDVPNQYEEVKEDYPLSTIMKLIAFLFKEVEYSFIFIKDKDTYVAPEIYIREIDDRYKIDIAFSEKYYPEDDPWNKNNGPNFRKMANKLASALMKLGKKVKIEHDEMLMKSRHVIFFITKAELEGMEELIF